MPRANLNGVDKNIDRERNRSREDLVSGQRLASSTAAHLSQKSDNGNQQGCLKCGTDEKQDAPCDDLHGCRHICFTFKTIRILNFVQESSLFGRTLTSCQISDFFERPKDVLL